jgi:hypothetical protein
MTAVAKNYSSDFRLINASVLVNCDFIRERCMYNQNQLIKQANRSPFFFVSGLRFYHKPYKFTMEGLHPSIVNFFHIRRDGRRPGNRNTMDQSIDVIVA